MLPGQKLVNGHISVEPLPPLWLLYCKSAERVHRPGSRRLGGVEATGASPGLAVGFACSARFFGQNCSKTPNMGWVVDWRGWEGPEVPGMGSRFFPMAARSTVRGSQLEED